jgi:imidazolonepropionase-like amidohydrolase
MPRAASRDAVFFAAWRLVIFVLLGCLPIGPLAFRTAVWGGESDIGELAEHDIIVVKASTLHVGNGRVITDGMAVVEDGRLQAVGEELEIPAGATIFESEGGSITPGLIDANARPRGAAAATSVTVIQTGYGSVTVRGRGADGEQSSEVVPHTRVLDTLWLDSPDFERLAREGVTTVYMAPDPSAVIGARGALLKTAGARDSRVIRPEGSVHAVIGSEPINTGARNSPARGRRVSLYTRRPTTRMGVTWVFRKAFYDTLRRSRGLPVGGADTPSLEATEVLLSVLKGETGLRVQAGTLADITTAVRLCGEFELPFLLEEPVEAYRCLDLVKSSGVPVILGPLDGGSRTERHHTLRALLESGVPTALSAQARRGENGLARQAMLAIRFGVEPEQALGAVTATPARLLGIDGDTGTLQKGKSADLVVWSGRPFAATSRPVLVVAGGEVVLEEIPRRRAEREPEKLEPEKTLRL